MSVNLVWIDECSTLTPREWARLTGQIRAYYEGLDYENKRLGRSILREDFHGDRGRRHPSMLPLNRRMP